MTRENRRYTATPNGNVYFTETEEVERDNANAAWTAGANDRAATEHRETRDRLLADSDWTQMPDSPLTDSQKTSWQTYRTSLRDLSDHANWPNLADDDWPTKP